jgi:hypothetical protein
MEGISTTAGGTDVEAALIEVRKVKETADHLAKGDAPGDADQFRVVAGLVHQLAEQVERIVAPMRPPIPGAEGYPEDHDMEAMIEEDRTPEDGPAEPLDDRAR